MRHLQNVGDNPVAARFPNAPDPTNYADDPDVKQMVLDEVYALIPDIRQGRQKINDRITRFRKCWEGIHTKKLYEGRADLYWRIAFKIIETFTHHLRTQVFPHTDSFYIEPSPFDPVALYEAPLIRRLLRNDVEAAGVERKLERFIRNGLVDGTSVVKNVWDTKTVFRYDRRAANVPSLAQGSAYETPTPMFQGAEIKIFDGPTFTPINLLDWYIHPITCSEVDEAHLIFEDVRVDRNYIRSHAEADRWSRSATKRAFERADKAQVTSETQGNKDDENSRAGISESEVARNLKRSLVIQECWVKIDLWGIGYDVPCKVVLCGEDILEVRQNPFFDQAAPYDVWRCIERQNNFMGMGLVEPVEHLNVAANSMGNQLLDAIAMQVNHILGVNVALLAQDVSTLSIGPRSIWPSLADPSEVFKEFRPQADIQSGLLGMQLLSGTMQDIAGTPPVMQGKFANKDGTTATETAAVSEGAAAGVTAMISNIEVQAMTPWLRRSHIREKQFRAVEEAVKIGGMIPMNVEPGSLVADYGMRWMSGSRVPMYARAAQEMSDVAASNGGALPIGAAPMLPSLGPGSAPQGLGTEPTMGL